MDAASQLASAYNDYTMTNNCSEGLDLRSHLRRNYQPFVSSHTRFLPPAIDNVKPEPDDNRATKLPLPIGSRDPTANLSDDKSKYIAKWCEDQRQFTQSKTSKPSSAKNDKPSSSELPTHDNQKKRFTHPLSRRDTKRYEEIHGQVAIEPTIKTLPDVQRSEFVQGKFTSCTTSDDVWTCKSVSK